ncbi:MAG TPA: hypothetical protein VGQ62_07140 [Chloroflexota bacterium]|jgi:hypothetical protein|nr:hypothetical protein [Chloroflexota bacterium]
MHESLSQQVDATRVAPSKSTLLLAIVAPFAAIALLASPLVFDALKHLAGQ